jgi:hypothetical protein
MNYKQRTTGRGKMRVAGLPILLFSFFVVINTAHGYVPMPEDFCNQRNMALCELNNIHYYTSDPCRPAAKTIKPLGTEHKQELTELMNLSFQRFKNIQVIAR